MNRSPNNERGHGIFIAKSLADMHEMQPNEGAEPMSGLSFAFQNQEISKFNLPLKPQWQ